MTIAQSISVIIPAHNAERFLGEAVRSLLGQNPRPLEIIIVDDGSTDGTSDVAAELEAGSEGLVRCIHKLQAGPSAARNSGLALARGGLIGFLDADDLWPENSLECRLAPFRGDAALAVVLGRTRYLWTAEHGSGEEMSPDSFPSPNLGSALFRRAAFDEVGGFNPALHYSEDVDWFLRARERGVTLAKIAQTTLLYRQHTANMTRGKTPADLQMLNVLKQSLDRRRQAGAARPLPGIPNSEGDTP